MDVLVVEDDDGLAEAIQQTLATHGYGTHRVGTGATALDMLPHADFVLLDLVLPDLTGHEVCRRIRELSCVPVIVISGSTDELDRVMALHMGADDFVAKPFGRYELVARIQAVLRRAHGCPGHSADRPGPAQPRLLPRPPLPPTSGTPAATTQASVSGLLRAGPLWLDPRSRKVLLDGKEARITRKEFDLLMMLMEAPGTVMRRQDIMCRVWGENWFGSTRTLDVHVGSLRSKLGNTQWIETVRGIGYRLAVPSAV